MRKFFLILNLLAFFQPLFSQNDYAKRIRHQFDSLKNILPTLKGREKVDCLNALTRKAFDLHLGSWQAEADTARPYAMLANKEAKRLGYKKGLGESYVNLETIDVMMFGTYAQGQRRFDTSSFKSAQQNAKNAITIGESLNDYDILSEAYFLLHWLANEIRNTGNRSQYVIADVENIKKAIGYFEKTKNKERLIRSYFEYAYLEALNNNFDVAIPNLEKALQLNLAAGNLDDVPFYYRHILRIYISTGDFENGLEYCKKYLQFAETLPKDKNGYNSEHSNALKIMAIIYTTAGDYETAKDLLNKALANHPTEDSYGLDFGISILGDIYRQAKNFDSARHYLEPFFKRNNKGAVYGLVNLSSLYLDIQEYDKALVAINSYKRLGKNVNDIGSDGIALTLEAEAYLGKKDYKTALRFASEGLPILKAAKRKVMIIRNYELLSKIFHALGKNDSAYYYLNQYTILKDSLLNRQLYFRLNSYKKQAEEEKRISQINLLLKDNLIKAQQLQQQLLLEEQNEAQLTLLDKDNEIKEQQLQIKDQELREQLFLKDRSQSQLTLLDKENKLKDQRLRQQAFIRNALIAGLFLLLALGIFIYRNLSLKRKNENLAIKKNRAEFQQKVAELEMQALRAQMNPHFIFNCLSSINKFILKNDTDTASDYLTRFSRLIRLGLTNSQLSLIPLSDEIEMLRLYLDMERLRFSDSFDYNIVYENTIEPETIYIPPMLLQPFCENAIWHGLMHKEGQGKLEIIMSIKDAQLQCVIMDNGIGREKAEELKKTLRQAQGDKKQKSFGLKITTERLALFNNEKIINSFYQSDDVLDTDGNIAGTKVALKINYKQTKEVPIS